MTPEEAAAHPLAGPARWGLIEVRLDDIGGPVDIAFEYTGAYARAGLRSLLSTRRRFGAPQHAHAVTLARAWADATHPLSAARTISLECDGPGGEGAMLGFVSFEPTAGEPPPPSSVAALVRAWMAVADEPTTGDEAVVADLEVLRRLPAGAWPLHLASLRPRGRDARRWVIGVPRPLLLPTLDRMQWPGSLSALASFVAEADTGRPYLSLHLDLGPTGTGPDVGLEFFLHRPPGSDGRWDPLLGALVARGLASHEGLTRLTSWAAPPAPTPRFVDIKVVLGRDGPRAAKGYLVFGAGNPGA